MTALPLHVDVDASISCALTKRRYVRSLTNSLVRVMALLVQAVSLLKELLASAGLRRPRCLPTRIEVRVVE